MSIFFDKIATYYDAMYTDDQEYKREIDRIVEIENKYNLSKNKSLLDIGCGTGEQTRNLAKYYSVTGIDISDRMLEIAMAKFPSGKFYHKNMFGFELKEKYGIAINLYGSIGFADNYKEMLMSLKCVWNCLEKGGILILTPWETKETYKDIILSDAGEKNGINFCRMENVKRFDNDKVDIEMVHLIGQNGVIEKYYNNQTVSLFSEQEYLAAIEDAGFELCQKLSGYEFRMGAFICRK